MAVAEPAVASMWAFMTSWFTPTILFCVLNLMIGTIFITSNFKTHNKEQQNHSEDHELRPQLVRPPSILERFRSINFSLYRSEQPDPLQPETTHHTDPPADQAPDQNQSHDQDHHLTRSKSAEASETPARVPVKMKKSASEKLVVETSFEDVEASERQRPATVRERKTKGNETASSAEDEEVDAKADDFINRFKQQLKLQRLDSILRYKEMLTRGSGK
uniref:DUF4408 domain-containing protein n=1 Tax=Davidia involucrata TaxID=16924 RepID=A0A5B7C5G4_DAVIN